MRTGYFIALYSFLFQLNGPYQIFAQDKIHMGQELKNETCGRIKNHTSRFHNLLSKLIAHKIKVKERIIHFFTFHH